MQADATAVGHFLGPLPDALFPTAEWPAHLDSFGEAMLYNGKIEAQVRWGPAYEGQNKEYEELSRTGVAALHVKLYGPDDMGRLQRKRRRLWEIHNFKDVPR